MHCATMIPCNDDGFTVRHHHLGAPEASTLRADAVPNVEPFEDFIKRIETDCLQHNIPLQRHNRTPGQREGMIASTNTLRPESRRKITDTMGDNINEQDKFDEMLRRIEAEQQASSAERSASRSIKRSSPERGDISRSPSPEPYDFADRARELRMSHDSIGRSEKARRQQKTNRVRMSFNKDESSRSLTPKRPEDATSRRQSRGSLSFTPPKRAEPESPLTKARGKYNKAKRSQPRPQSAGNTPEPERTLSDARSSCTAIVPLTQQSTPNQREEEFKEKCKSSLMLAHDTIKSLEQDVRSLEKCASSFKNKNAALEQKNTMLRDECKRLNEENKFVLAEKTSLSKKYNKKIEKLRSECDGYEKYVREIERLSGERDASIQDIVKSKQNLERDVQDRDRTITGLRDEIQRLTEELEKASIAMSQVVKAEKSAKALTAGVSEESKREYDSGTRVVVDLNHSNITITRPPWNIDPGDCST